jgi:hypothetical protein
MGFTSQPNAGDVLGRGIREAQHELYMSKRLPILRRATEVKYYSNIYENIPGSVGEYHLIFVHEQYRSWTN